MAIEVHYLNKIPVIKNTIFILLFIFLNKQYSNLYKCIVLSYEF